MASKSLSTCARRVYVVTGPRAGWISTDDSELSVSYRDGVFAYVLIKSRTETMDRVRMSTSFGITIADLRKIYRDANESDLYR